MLGRPQLTKRNYAYWLYPITSFSEEHDIAEQLKGEVTAAASEAAQTKANKKRAQAGWLVISTISDVLGAELGDVITRLQPHQMLAHIADHLASDTLPEEHERLMEKALNTCMRRGEGAEQYLKRDDTLRQEIIKAQYPKH